MNSSDFERVHFLAQLEKKKKENLQMFLWADKSILLNLSLVFRVCPGHSGYFCLSGTERFPGEWSFQC